MVSHEVPPAIWPVQFALEGYSPGDTRLDRISLKEIKPLLHEAIDLGVERGGLTGGEPFIVGDFVNILNYASKLRPCLVLTNGTDALLKRLHQLEALRQNPHRVSFRISIDWPDRERHEQSRGAGTFDQSLESIVSLQALGFAVSLARQTEAGENSAVVDDRFRELARAAGYKGNIRVVAFPDFATPGSNPLVPAITEDCMTRYQDEASRRQFMCAFSKMVVKKAGRLRVYACTLVDDDEDYDQGSNLREALQKRVLLKHHRCYSCFAYGSSCSEL